MAKKIAEFMSQMPEVEVLIATDENGNLIAGKAVTQRDNAGIAKSAINAINAFKEFLHKLTAEEDSPRIISSESDKVISVLIKGNGIYLIAAISPEVRATLGLIKQNLRILINSLK